MKFWHQVTLSSNTQWVRDAVTEHNTGDLFAYKGGAQGVYVRINRTGTAEAGEYHGAFPHIGEACFRKTFEKQFASMDEAFARVAECLGAGFVVNVLTGFPSGR